MVVLHGDWTSRLLFVWAGKEEKLNQRKLSWLSCDYVGLCSPGVFIIIINILISFANYLKLML